MRAAEERRLRTLETLTTNSDEDVDDWSVDTQGYAQDKRRTRTQLGTGAEAVPVNNWTRICVCCVHALRLGKG